ncbi:uncharacterized protein DUF2442 [Methylobacter tundripaludum]|uniref:Uncharacterized protein DUF2442 n=1 Tax=Methylobacter tundripaludum TaxID=173365 RepID=A0A2S6HEH3_9GAMM|nr:DUF2442 domain-containing protein [Methylobacter tundripaludum]PPK75791.1 uncharacterized protein DUF2442 [Methylobacter tundripaludum]
MAFPANLGGVCRKPPFSLSLEPAYSGLHGYVEIEDGRKGVFDLKPYLDHGVFRELRNVHYFNQVGILFGAVTWPNEQDIAPEALLAGMVPMESISAR